MLKNYLKITFRVLWKNKGQTLINISGLGVGIGCCLLIILFVNDELSFDSFHAKSNRIYRAWLKLDNGNSQVSLNTITPFPLGNALQENFQEVEATVRLIPIAPWLKVGDNKYTERVSFVGPNFFQVFDFSMPDDHRANFSIEPKDAIITSSKALKYFGEEDPVNQNISIQIGQNFEDFRVKAVVANPPSNSSIQFDVLISDANLGKLYHQQRLDSDWITGFPETYVLLKEGANVSTLENKFPAFFKNVLSADFKGKYKVGLQPLSDIHLNTDFPPSFAPIGDLTHSFILTGIAFLILFMACINFITLSIGMSLNRAKEVGLRKAIGAQRLQLMVQFIGEALLVTTLSLVLGFLVAIVSLPVFNELSGKRLFLQPDGVALLTGLFLLLIIGLLAGSYPAFVLSGLKPISVLKQKVQSTGKQALRKTLVGLQMILSILLISSTLTMRQQLDYVQNKDIGFDKDRLVVIGLNVPKTGNLIEVVNAGFDKATQFKTELSKYPNLEVFSSSHVFGQGKWTNIGFTDEQGVYGNFNLNIVDERFITALKVDIVVGRNFSVENPRDAEGAIIVNEAFVKKYGWKNPIGMKIPGKKFVDHEIIGVVKDFNYSSLYDKIAPLVLSMNPIVPLSGHENITINSSPIPKLIIKLPLEKTAEALTEIKAAWYKLSDNEEFSFHYVDQRLDAQYRNDQNLSKIVKIASIIAIFIGGLGLYALAALAMQSRAKEISIRKVMGASEKYLMLLLAKGYMYLIGGCIIISAPITFYFMNQWLRSFEYRISPGWKVFGVTSALSILMGILVISYQTISIARTNPVDAVKTE